MILMNKINLKRILFIHHSPSPNTIKLSKHLEAKIKQLNPNIILIVSNSIETNIDSFRSIDGVIIGTTENFGYMSGLTKDFFDRTYEDLQNKMEGLPVFYYVRAGLDGNGCQIGIDKILTGLKWRQVVPPLILKGEWHDNFIKKLEEKSLTFVNGIEIGIY